MCKVIAEYLQSTCRVLAKRVLRVHEKKKGEKKTRKKKKKTRRRRRREKNLKRGEECALVKISREKLQAASQLMTDEA